MRAVRCNSRILTLTLFALLVSSSARAQVETITPATATPIPAAGHDYIKGLSEIVNPSTGSVSVRIATPTPSGRRMTLPLSFSYDSNGILVASSTGWRGSDGYITVGGWSYSLPMLSYRLTSQQKQIGPSEFVNCQFLTDYNFSDPEGIRHPVLTSLIPNGPAPHCDVPSGPAVVAGNRFSMLYEPFPQVIAARDGTVYHLGQSVPAGPGPGYIPDVIEDSNGNKITIVDSSPQNPSPFNIRSFAVSDDIGRPLVSSSGIGSNGDTVQIAGISNPYTLAWSQQSVNFSTTWTNINPPPVGLCQPVGTASSSPRPAISAITLPNGKQYTFGYDSTYGLLNKITYPSGAYVSYQWGVNAQSGYQTQPLGTTKTICEYVYDRPAILHRIVSFDGVTPALQQDFAYSHAPITGFVPGGIPPGSTTVTTHDLIQGTTSITVYNYDNLSGSLVEHSILYKDGNGNTLRTVNKTWNNPYDLQSESVTLDNGLTSKTTYTYLFSEIAEKDEYDFGQTTPSRKTVYTYQSFPASPLFPTASPTVSPFASPMLNKACSVVVSDGAGNRVAETDYFYDNAPTTTPCGASGTPSVSAVSGLITGTHDETNYAPASASPRGNLTNVIHRCFPSCSDSVTTYSYDETGQVLSAKDPDGNTTQYSFADSYTDSTPPGNTNAYLTQITRPTTNGVSHIEKFAYAYSDGHLTRSTDQNNFPTQYSYSDPLRRLTETDYPDGGQTIIAYNDTTLTVTASKKINTGQTQTTVAVADGLGHVKQTQLTSDPQGTVFTDTTYDGFGRVHTASNPYRSSSDSTYGLTTYVYDAIGRTTAITAPDASVTATSYTGACTTVTDPAGKVRQACSDALGRLTQVTEAPGGLGYVTSYSYNTLNDLTGTVQNGSHNRSFVYDSLSRLTSATNPESHTIGYAYDANGNLVSKTDGRSISTTYSYDSLNRLTHRSYSDGSLAMAYQYDGDAVFFGAGANGLGRLTITSNGDGSFADHISYDPMGRVALVRHCLTGLPTNEPCWPTTYSYDLAGNLISLTYPSGRTVKYQYNGASRPNLVTFDNLNGISVGYNYLTGATYAPHGAPTTITLGNGLTETNAYNDRLQLCSQQIASSAATLLNRVYNFYPTAGATCQPGSGGNNGNVMGVADNLVPGRTQAFSYDSLNRIATAQTSATSGADCWAQQFGYDAWGNLLTETPTRSGCPMTTLNVTVNGNNQITNSGFSYDAAGNLLTDGTGGNHYIYDGESRIKSLNSGAAVYTYGADGDRVIKQVGTDQTDYLYSYVHGEVLSEYKPATSTWTDYIFVGSRRLASASATVSTPAGGSVVGDPLQNGGFEQGAQNWGFGSSSQIITDSTRAHSGSNYLQISSSSLASAHSTQMLPVSPGNTVTFGGWAYRESGTTGSCRWKLEALDANQNPIAFLNPTPSDTASATWTFQIRTYTVPANVAFVFLYAEVYQATAPTVARFDDGFLDVGTGTADPGFETGIQGWTVSGALTEQVLSDPTKAHSGNNYLELSTSTAGDAYSTSNLQIPVSVGQTVSYGGWRFHESGTFSYARWFLVIQGVNGGQASHPPDDSVFGSWLFQTNSSLTVPTFLECPCTANLRIEMLTNPGDPVNAARFDDGFLTVTGDAAPTTNTVFYHGDQLGSTRLLTDSTGTTTWSATYLPYGQEWNPVSTTNHYKFNGQERDSESGLDDFGARYYSSNFGRFVSADWSEIPVPVPYANLTNPQTLNLYAIVYDNPETFADLDGHTSTSYNGPAPNGCVQPDDRCREEDIVDAQHKDSATQKEEQSSVVQDVKDTAAGALSAWAKDNGASGPLQGNDLGQAIGHIGALVQGMYEIVQGGTVAIAGGTEALATAPAGATGVGLVIPGAGVAAAVVGVAEAAHGAAVFANTLSNIYMASEHSKGERESTRGKHEEGQARTKRDQGGTKADKRLGRVPRNRPPGHKGPWPPPGTFAQ
jgi:RHS repeat-associated protein